MPEQTETPTLSILAPVETPPATTPVPVETEPMMDAEARVAYARAILANGPAKKADFLAFMRGYMRDLAASPDLTITAPSASSSDIEAALEALKQAQQMTQVIMTDVDVSPTPDVDEARFSLPVDVTPTGAIHLPISANRTYARDEALALARKIKRLASS